MEFYPCLHVHLNMVVPVICSDAPAHNWLALFSADATVTHFSRNVGRQTMDGHKVAASFFLSFLSHEGHNTSLLPFPESTQQGNSGNGSYEVLWPSWERQNVAVTS